MDRTTDIPRAAWDTDSLRANAQALYSALSDLLNAQADSKDKAERALADAIPPLPLLRSWRLERLARRYPPLRAALDAIMQALPSLPSYPDNPARVRLIQGKRRLVRDRHYAHPLTEAQRERAEREYRERAFPSMGEADREARALSVRSYGEQSAQAEREGEAIQRLGSLKRQGFELLALALWYKEIRSPLPYARLDREGEDVYATHRPKSGAFRPEIGRVEDDGKHFIVQYRYPIGRVIRRWWRICEGKTEAGSGEITTADDRKRRKGQAQAKATIRAAASISHDKRALEALMKIAELAKARFATV